MKPLFDKYNVDLFGISGDSVADVNMHIKRDNLDFIQLLSDENLDLVRQYGVENHKSMGADPETTIMIAGLPFPTRFNYRAMAIPTSILIYEHGKILWIDQSPDYRLRASKETLTEVLEKSFNK